MQSFRPISIVVASLAGFIAPAAARAEQIVLFDTTYTHTNANDSHHGISGAALNQPDNWTSPIDYTQGTIHFYQEVMTKPSNRETIIDFCLISTRDYGCIETFVYTTTGLHETVRSMAGKDVDKRAVIDFTHKMQSIQMVLKTPAPTYINGGKPQSDFLPSKMRFVATLVSPGGTYVPPAPTPGFEADGGAPVTVDAAAPPAVDAAATPGADAAVAIDAAASLPPDAAPAPPVADASSPRPPKADAAVKPPRTEDPAPEEEAPTAHPSSGCAVGGRPGGLGLLVLLATALSIRARRRR
jgi:hypothetical protein